MENQKYCIVDVTVDINKHIGVVDLSLEDAKQWIMDNQIDLENPISIDETTFNSKFIIISFPLILLGMFWIWLCCKCQYHM